MLMQGGLSINKIKIGLVSDTHGFIDKEILDFFSDVNEIWHAGDIGSEDVLNCLENLKPMRAVYGNVDNYIIRKRTKHIQRFIVCGIDVLMIHIGGYPGRYVQEIKEILKQNPPDLFISGHSHILKIINDKKHKLLHINPGAAGKFGWHRFITAVKFDIEDGKIKDIQVFEKLRK